MQVIRGVPFCSIFFECLVVPSLYVMVVEALGDLLAHKVGQGVIKVIPLTKPKIGELVNGHFIDDSFLAILEDKESMDNTMEFPQTFCTTSSLKFNLQKLNATSKVPITYMIGCQPKGSVGFNQVNFLSF